MFRVSDLTVAIKKNQQVVLRGVNFEILPGETLRLKGKNGSGKTHILDAIHLATGAKNLYGNTKLDPENRIEILF